MDKHAFQALTIFPVPHLEGTECAANSVSSTLAQWFLRQIPADGDAILFDGGSFCFCVNIRLNLLARAKTRSKHARIFSSRFRAGEA